MIRDATAQDIPEIVASARAMHAESRYRVLPFDRDRVAGLVDWLIGNPNGLAIVAEHEGRIVGGVLAAAEPHFFSSALVAQEYGIFVDPSQRGTLLGVRLYHRYTAWAQTLDAAMIQAGVSTGVHHDKTAGLLRSLGYVDVGQLFEFQMRRNDD